jgi:hypothetical protein
MSKRFDNKKLLYVLGVLAAILLVTFLVKIPGEKATIKEKLLDIDTSRVEKIIVIPRLKDGDPFEFTRNGDKWTVTQGNITAAQERGAAENMLAELAGIRPTSLEAVDKSAWKDFNLTDSLAIRVKALGKNGKLLADLMIGRFTYNQSSNPYAGGSPGGIQGTSYVRLNKENKVYGVDGFLSLSFSGRFSDYRDKTFLTLQNTGDITKITFRLPADSSFALSHKGTIWYSGDQVADSSATAEYLNGLRYVNGDNFRDGFKPSADPVCQIEIEGNNLLNINVKCYKGDSNDEFVMNSSLNPDVYFTSKREGIYNRLFRPEKYFLSRPEKNPRK